MDHQRSPYLHFLEEKMGKERLEQHGHIIQVVNGRLGLNEKNQKTGQVVKNRLCCKDVSWASNVFEGYVMAISGTKETPVILCINPVYSTVDSLACPRFQAQTTGQTTLPFQGGAGMGCRQLNGASPSKPLNSCHDQSQPPQTQYSEARNSYL